MQYNKQTSKVVKNGKVGRPLRTYKGTRKNIFIYPHQDKQLKELSLLHNMSESSIIQRLIDDYSERLNTRLLQS